MNNSRRINKRRRAAAGQWFVGYALDRKSRPGGFLERRDQRDDDLLLRGVHSRRVRIAADHCFCRARQDLRWICGYRFNDHPSPCNIHRADCLDAASHGYRPRLCGHDPRNGELAQCARSAIHARAAPVNFRCRLNGFLGNGASASQHCRARKRNFVPRRVAVDIRCGCSDHVAAKPSSCRGGTGTGRAQGRRPRITSRCGWRFLNRPGYRRFLGHGPELRPEDRT